MTTIELKVPKGKAMCQVCKGLYGYTPGSKIRGKEKPSVIYIHGPKDNRCPGSRQPIEDWIVAQGLPKWEEMSDLDKGCALMHIWKRKWEGVSYAREHYPCKYVQHEDLKRLKPEDACRHAYYAIGTFEDSLAKLGDAEVQRLYNMALSYDRNPPIDTGNPATWPRDYMLVVRQ